jgi:hypothetical protein
MSNVLNLIRQREVEKNISDAAVVELSRSGYDGLDGLIPELFDSLVSTAGEDLIANKVSVIATMTAMKTSDPTETSSAVGKPDVQGVPNSPGRPRRVVHMHIPKTAGTALRTAFSKVNDDKLRIFPHYDERQFSGACLSDWDVFSGHFGYKTAKSLDGQLVTVFRNPIDRFVSVYYFWRELLEKNIEVTRKTQLTRLYDLENFIGLRDELSLIEEFFNRMTWQVAYGSSVQHRKELRDIGKTDDDILAMATRNLEEFSVVGLQEEMPQFVSAMKNRFNVDLEIGPVNVTERRPAIEDLPVRVRKQIFEWVYLDVEIYEAARRFKSKV